MDNLYLRKIDIKSWESPVARQHGVRRLPNFVVYGPEGNVISDGRKAYEGIMKWPKDGPPKGSSSTPFSFTMIAVVVVLVLLIVVLKRRTQH